VHQFLQTGAAGNCKEGGASFQRGGRCSARRKKRGKLRSAKDSKLAKAKANIKASVLLISGCQDNQLSQDGAFNGLFTGTLKKVWNGGIFKGCTSCSIDRSLPSAR